MKLEQKNLFFRFCILGILCIFEFRLYIIVGLPTASSLMFLPSLAVLFLAGLGGGVQAVDVGSHVAIGSMLRWGQELL